MKKWIVSSAVAALLLVPIGLTAQKAQMQSVFAHVLNSGAEPIKDLSAADFVVSQGSTPAKVVRATYGGDPERIILLVDTSEAMSNKVINPLRAGLQTLIDGIPVEDDILLATMGRQLRLRQQPGEKRTPEQAAADRKKVKDSANGFFSDGGGTVLLDSLDEINNRFIAKNDDRQFVVVIVTTEGPESSSSTHEEEFNKLVGALVGREVTVHVVLLSDSTSTIGSGIGSANPSVGTSAGVQTIVAMNLTANTGGYLKTINTATALPDTLREVSARIRADHDALKDWYQVDYSTTTAGSRQVIDVEVQRPDVKVELSSGRPGKELSVRSIR
jgi:hypothetical protein